jgi:hypothetical protein
LRPGTTATRTETALIARDVVGEPDHARGLGAGRGLELVEGHHRAGADLDDIALDAEVLEHAREQLGVLFEGVFVERGDRLAVGRRVQKIERRKLVFAGRKIELALAGGVGALARLGLGRRRNQPGARRCLEVRLARAWRLLGVVGTPAQAGLKSCARLVASNGEAEAAGFQALEPRTAARRHGRGDPGRGGAAASPTEADHGDGAARAAHHGDTVAY